MKGITLLVRSVVFLETMLGLKPVINFTAEEMDMIALKMVSLIAGVAITSFTYNIEAKLI